MAEETDGLTEKSAIDTSREPNAEISEAGDQTEAIKARIEDKRHQMGETIDAIQERLSFSNISEQVTEQVNNAIETVKDTVYDATIGKAVIYMKDMGNEISGSSAVKMVRSNPLPFILIAAGAGMLAFNSYRGSKSSNDGRRQRQSDQTIGGEGSSQSLLGTAGEKVSDAARGVGDAAGTAYQSVSKAASSTYAGIANSAGNAYTGAGELAGRAYDKAGEYGKMAQDTYDTHIEENPLAIGAVALALGAAVGFAIPSTRYEGDLMGSASQNLLQKAQDSAGGLVDRVKQEADEAGESIKADCRIRV